MERISSYPSLFNIGHRAIQDLLNHEVYVEEKIDGSQFSFGLVNGELICRSKGVQINLEDPGMFSKGVDAARARQSALNPGWIYRGEFLQKPKHNTLCYDRTPRDHFILFDVEKAEQDFCDYEMKQFEADRLGLEVVPLIFQGKIESAEQLRSLMDRTSILGGVKAEGVVVKPVGYHLYGQDKKCLIGKFVSEDFKEVHDKSWKASNPGKIDTITMLAIQHRTPARFLKAYQKLRDSGKITDTPKDIGILMKEVPEDILKECVDDIKEELFKWAWPQIKRQVTHGLPEWYKEKLMKECFDVGTN